MGIHHSIKHSPQPSRVVASGHEHNGMELMLIAPCGKHLSLSLGSTIGSGSRDLHDVHYAKPSQLPTLPCSPILIREPTADELVVSSTWRVGKNRNSHGYPTLHEICRFEGSRASGISRYDNDVSRCDRFFDDECPSCSAQDRLSKGRHSGNRGQCSQHEDTGPSPPLGAHPQVHGVST